MPWRLSSSVILRTLVIPWLRTLSEIEHRLPACSCAFCLMGDGKGTRRVESAFAQPNFPCLAAIPRRSIEPLRTLTKLLSKPEHPMAGITSATPAKPLVERQSGDLPHSAPEIGGPFCGRE